MPILTWITVGWTFLLMVWGNLVSATGSGLACPDWPLCRGTLTPPAHPDVIMEWGHRLLAAGAFVLIVACVVQTWRLSKTNPMMKRLLRSYLIGLVMLLIAQVLLGGLTVMLGLSVLASTIHLVNANIIFAGLILLACVATWGKKTQAVESPKLKRLAVTGLAALMIQLLLGALVRHGHAGLACPSFPNCLDRFFPSPLTPQNFVAFVHRWWGVLLLGVFVHIRKVSIRQSPTLSPVGRLLMSFSVFQVLLGILTVRYALQTHLRATHAAVGYGLWALLCIIAFRSGAFRSLWDSSEKNSAL